MAVIFDDHATVRHSLFYYVLLVTAGTVTVLVKASIRPGMVRYSVVKQCCGLILGHC